MTNPSRAFKRLGMVGAAAVVGLVPVALAGGSAFAAVSNPNLSVTPTTTNSTSQVVDSFTTGTALPANGTITINSTDNSGCPVALPASANLSTSNAATNYAVTFTPSNGSATPATGAVVASGTATCSSAYGGTATATSAVITLTTPIPAGSAVTITINNAQNPPVPSGVYFQDSTSTDTQVINTNVVSIGNATVSTPGVTSVNPTAYTNGGGEPFTVTGTNFSTQYSSGSFSNANPPVYTAGATPSPVVCFVESDVTVPAASATNPCPASGTAYTNHTVAPATPTAISTGEIQGVSPTLNVGKTYNVVVYNYNGGATTPTYTAASGTSSQTLVGVTQNATGLNVVPESGVRVVDSRTGLDLPRGALSTGSPSTPVAIPLSSFAQSLTLPTNLPPVGSYTGLAVNVTAVAPSSGGNIQMWAANSGTACPNGLAAGAIQPATVNFQPPQDTNNNQIIPVGAGDDELCVQDNGAAVNLVVDITGYTTSGSGYTQEERRLLDTRTGQGNSSAGSQGLLGPLQPNTVYRFQTGQEGTYTLNVADVAPGAQGNLRVFPEVDNGNCTSSPATSSTVPNTAVDNYIPNTDSSAELITTIPCSGYLDIYNASTAPVNVVIDELGYFGGNGVPAPSITALPQPYRIYDSRPGPINAAGTVTVPASPSGSGANFVPGGALGIVGSLSDINPTGQGYEVTFPAGGTVPGTATIAHFPNQTRNTNAVTALNPSNGSFSIYNAGASTNSTFDVTAYIS